MDIILLQASTTPNPQDLFTWGSFTTLLGATSIVYIVCGVVQSVFNFSPKWFALLISIIVSFIGASINTGAPTDSHEISPIIKHLIALLNGLLIYTSASGSNQLINYNRTPEPLHPSPGPLTPAPNDIHNKRKFNTNWWSP